jgi:hypothetical protein
MRKLKPIKIYDSIFNGIDTGNWWKIPIIGIFVSKPKKKKR